MEVSNFFSRLLQTSRVSVQTRPPDDVTDFDAAWRSIRETLEQPDERQLVRGIAATDVPRHLKHMVNALVYEGNRTDEDTTGACLEYFLRNNLLAQLELLCEADRPHGVKAEVVKSINNLVVLLSERFLIHNAVHRPLRRLLRSCIGEGVVDDVDVKGLDSARGPSVSRGSRVGFEAGAMLTVVGSKKLMGAAGMVRDLSRMDDELEADLVDLMCILCSRMRAYPPLLLIFFHDKGWLVPHPRPTTPTSSDPSRALSPTSSTKNTSTEEPPTFQTSQTTHHFEFLVFSYLLRFVHREGRTGDLARAGLLFLFDIAFLTPQDEGGDNLAIPPAPGSGGDPLQDARDALGEYVLDGDFSDVMAAGLGAIYSLLPTKLRVPGISETVQANVTVMASVSGGMHLGDIPAPSSSGNRNGSDEDNEDVDPRLQVHSSLEPEIKSQLDLFLKLFGFIQDILLRCNSPLAQADPHMVQVTTAHVLGPAISDATLDAIETSFIDGVLYPSILECSPTDGSAVAVLTYLNVLVSYLDDGPLLKRILTVLMDTKDVDLKRGITTRKNGDSSHDFLTAVQLSTGEDSRERGGNYYDDSGKFTLKDLILDNLRSNNPASSIAALRLLDSLLVKHCSYATSGLISIIRDPTATSFAKQSLPKLNYNDLCAPMTVNERNDNDNDDDDNDDDYNDDDDDDDDDMEEQILPPAVNSTNVHLQEVELYGSLLSRLDPNQTTVELSQGYATYLTDIQFALKAEECFQPIPLQFISISGEVSKVSEGSVLPMVRVGNFDRDPRQHRMNPSDPLIHAVLSALGRFFQRTADENVALTGVVASLALCSNRSMAGWMLYDVRPTKVDPWARVKKAQSGKKRNGMNRIQLDDDAASDQSLDEDLERELKRQCQKVEEPSGDPDPFSARSFLDLPAIYQILRDLVRQVARFRAEVDDFDRLMSERRMGLLFTDHLDEAMNINLNMDTYSRSSPFPGGLSGSGSGSGNPGGSIAPGSPSSVGGKSSGRPGGGLGSSLKSFLTPRKRGQSTTPSQVVAGSFSTPASLPRTELANRSPRFGSTSTTFNNKNSTSPLSGSSPFQTHYDEATSSSLYAQSASPVATGPWSPAASTVPRVTMGSSTTNVNAETTQSRRSSSTPLALCQKVELGEVDVFGSGNQIEASDMEVPSVRNGKVRVGVNDSEDDDGGPRRVTLSAVLDNVVILEEFIKEIVGIIMARRALGIDQVGFVST